MNGVTDLHLYIIWAAIDGCEWDPDKHSGETLREGECAIAHVPPAMASALISIKDPDLRRIASHLAPSEDFGWTTEEVSNLITIARDFAKRSQGHQICIEVSL